MRTFQALCSTNEAEVVCRPCVWRACGPTACATWWWCTATGGRTPRRTSCWEWTSPARRGRSELPARQDGLSGSTKLSPSSWVTCICRFQQEKGHGLSFLTFLFKKVFGLRGIKGHGIHLTSGSLLPAPCKMLLQTHLQNCYSFSPPDSSVLME